MLEVVIIGAGGHAKVVLDACLSSGMPVRGFLDRTDAVTGPRALPILGGDDLLNDDSFRAGIAVMVGIGLPKPHRRVTDAALAAGARFARVIHASAIVSDTVEIGTGTFVNAGAVINADTRIADHCIVNTRVSIDHDCELGEFVNIAPGAVLAGGVRCGEGVFVGAGATVGPGVALGKGAVVASGAAVLHDVPPNTTVGGVPAKPIRTD